MRRTKIVCTIGPASEEAAVIGDLLAAGMNVARLNFAHGSLAEHERRIRTLREEAGRLGVPLGILADVQGPKLRIGELAGGTLELAPGQELVLTTREGSGERGKVPVPHPELPRALQPGGVVYLDDGLIELEVLRVDEAEVYCRVTVGGELSSRKGITVPGVELDLPPLTDEDKAHIEFGLRCGVDFVAASFVRRAEHVEVVRELVAAAGGRAAVIAKIETASGVRNLAGIVAHADGVMVARGDLGVQIPPEEVPLVQKEIIATCHRAGKPVITATQMLESMVRNPRPTRAEVSDVAWAITEGTDAVMLSGETAVGRYPVLAVRVMDRICRRIEASLDYEGRLEQRRVEAPGQVAEAISYATCRTATDLRAAAIICSTQSGATARMISKFRPRSPILGVTPEPAVARQLTVVWGVRPLQVPRAENIDDMIDVAVEGAVRTGLVRVGDTVAISAGVKTGTPGSTNLLQVHRVEV